MDINYIADKRYYELNDEDIKFVDKVLEDHDISLDLKNKIFIRFLFDYTIRQSVTNL